jgi:hypothetical protein
MMAAARNKGFICTTPLHHKTEKHAPAQMYTACDSWCAVSREVDK